MRPYAAALQGAREVGFTVLSMSISLIAVFIPILLMGGIVGRLFREFAVTLAITILISALVSLTLVPMMSARWLRRAEQSHARSAFGRHAQTFFGGVMTRYYRSLNWVLAHQGATLVVAFATVMLAARRRRSAGSIEESRFVVRIETPPKLSMRLMSRILRMNPE